MLIIYYGAIGTHCFYPVLGIYRLQPDTCLCKPGWRGPECADCVPYWDCPPFGFCIEPNQCYCSTNSSDPYCNHHAINGELRMEATSLIE